MDGRACGAQEQAEGWLREGTVQRSFHRAHPKRRGWTHQRSAAAVPSGSPSHSFSSDCSRYSSAQRAGDTDKGSARSRGVRSQRGSREGRI